MSHLVAGLEDMVGRNVVLHPRLDHNDSTGVPVGMANSRGVVRAAYVDNKLQSAGAWLEWKQPYPKGATRVMVTVEVREGAPIDCPIFLDVPVFCVSHWGQR